MQPSGYRRFVDIPLISVTFEHTTSAASDVRAAIRRCLPLPDVLAAPVVLVSSELVSNVIRHTGSGGQARLWDPQPEVPLRLEVQDSQRTPLAGPSEALLGGRGLQIVDALADSWGVTYSKDMKVVWAEFDRVKGRNVAPPQTPVAPDDTGEATMG